jgi:hypothetical protein
VVRGTFFLEYEIGGHGKIEGGAVMIMRMVSVNLKRCSMCGVDAEVEVEVVFADRGSNSPPARSGFRLQRHSAFGLLLQLIT